MIFRNPTEITDNIVRMTKNLLKSNEWACWAAGLLAGSIVYMITSAHGIGISPDSVSYLGTARNIANNKWLINFDDCPLVIFPVGYPIMLYCISSLFARDVLLIAPGINAVLICLTIVATGKLSNNIVANNPWPTRAVLLIASSSACLFEVHAMLWSETLAIALTMWGCLLLGNYLRRPNYLTLLPLGAVAGICCDVRLAGVAIGSAFGLVILLQKGLKAWKKMGHLIVYGFLALSLLVANLIRNNRVHGTLTGHRLKSLTSFWQNFFYFSQTIGLWTHGSFPLGNLVDIILGAIFLIGTAYMAFQFVVQKERPNEKTIASMLCLVYFSFIILSSTFSRYEKINGRLLSLGYPATLCCCAWFADFCFQKFAIGKKNFARIIIVSATLFYSCLQIKGTFNYCKNILENGIPGYAELTWLSSDIVTFLKEYNNRFDREQLIYSNASDAVYYFGGIPAMTLPEPDHKLELYEYYHEEGSYLIWFENEFNNRALINLTEIRKHRRLDTIAKLKDATIFWSRMPSEKTPPLPSLGL